MHRREALKNVAFLLGGAISASTMGVLFESFTLPENEKNFVSFSAQDEKIFAEFANIIVPTTKSSPGAKAAGLGKFIPMMMKDCYPATMQTSFARGFQQLQEKAMKDFPPVKDEGWIHYVHFNEKKHGLNKMDMLPPFVGTVAACY